jgi:dienelactone hydrolase
MSTLLRSIAACLLLAAAQSPPAADAPDLPRGQVVGKVACKSNPGQSYALYLPSRYVPDRPWPILYAFDAGARGALPVERFREAAERYGYIVVGSNNSHNGPTTIADEALRAMLADTGSRFSLDGRRVYATGFSGGARVAVMAGLALGGKAAGVIGCAAGFPPSVEPSASLPFAYFGTVGTDDFNYPELVQLDETLAKLRVPHQLEVFEGGHDWPPVAACTRAIEWMELQAMRSAIRPTDAAMVDAILDRAVAEARADEDSHHLVQAFERYSAISEDFAGLRDVAPFAQKARQLAGTKEVRSALAERRDSITGQRSAEASIGRLFEHVASGQERALAVRELAAALDDLRRQGKEPRNGAARMAARRVLTESWSQLNEAISEDFERNDVALAAARLELMAHIRPENAQVDYQLARALARGGRKKAAVEALQRAVRKGFKDVAALEREADFASLTGEDGFRAVVALLKR